LEKHFITSLKTRICYDSRGDKSLEAEVMVGQSMGRACAPRGASAGKFEAINFPPGGVEEAIKFSKEYSSKLIGQDASDIYTISNILREIDGTENYERIGGAAAYAISIAAAEAASKASNIPLYKLLSSNNTVNIPYPIGNVLGGGKHAGPGSPDIQEFLVCALVQKIFMMRLR